MSTIPAPPPGRLIGIALRAARRLPMQLVQHGMVVACAGLVGDHKGDKFPARGITILAIEDWRHAIADLTDLAGPVPLPWTARRANLLVEGLRLPRARGAIIEVGAIRLEVTAQTFPCKRMDEAHPGLLKALGPHWRGGVSCRVIGGGAIRVGDRASVASSPPESTIRLPG